MKQLPLPIVAPATARFDTFVAGANAAALQHLEQMGAGPTPVFVWGPSGSGKTHLLHALAHQRQQRGERVGWFDPSRAAAVDDGARLHGAAARRLRCV